MKKKNILFTFILVMGTLSIAKAQSWWPAPVYFPQGKQLCDNDPWQLVFFDDFNGTSIDHSKWYTFNTNGGYTNDNWCEARIGPQNHAIVWDENVIESNGTVKLYVKQHTSTWDCTSCSSCNVFGMPITRKYTGGYLSSVPTFNSGRFVARIKFPVFREEHATWWLWRRNPQDVDEIDLAESGGWLLPPSTFNNRPVTNFNLHAWDPDGSNNDVSYKYRYPHQSELRWWYAVSFPWGSSAYFNQNAWHTYRCDWDTASISVYLDNQIVDQIWKYIKTVSHTHHFLFFSITHHVTEGSTCIIPQSGDWKIMPGFPYIEDAECKLDFTSDLNIAQQMYSSDTTLGDMEIDWVQVFQHHPQLPTPLCNQIVVQPVLSGPSVLCTGATYSVTPAVQGGVWSADGIVSLDQSWQSGNTSYASFLHSGPVIPGTGTIKYEYPSGPAGSGCPMESVAMNIACYLPIQYGHPNTFVVNTTANTAVLNTQNTFSQVINSDSTSAQETSEFQFFVPNDVTWWDKIPADTDMSYPSFKWDIDLVSGSGADTQHFHKYGRFVSVPDSNSIDSSYYLHWEVTMAIPSGDSISWEGYRTPSSTYGRQSNDTSNYYFNAVIDDTAAYLDSFRSIMDSYIFPYGVADSIIDEYDEKALAEALAPYLIPPSKGLMYFTSNGAHLNQDDTRLYPIPVGKRLFIIPGKIFQNKQPLQIEIYDLTGRLRIRLNKKYIKGGVWNIPLSGLNPGAYIVILRQADYSEHHEIVKSGY